MGQAVRPLRLEPLNPERFDDFWSLFEGTLSAPANEIAARLGISREAYERLPHEVGRLFQIEGAAGVVGYLWLEARGGVLHVHALLLRASHRHRGLGRRVLQLIVERYRDQIDVVELAVEPANAAARHLYENAGFAYVGERDGFLIMRLDLQPNASPSKPRRS